MKRPDQYPTRPAIDPHGDGSPESGFSLIVTLILLVIVTLLGVAASQMVLLGERSARYDRDHQIAYQAAEAALREAEFDIREGTRKTEFARKRGDESKAWVDAGCGTGNDRGKCRPVEDVTGNKPIWYQVDFTDASTTTAQSAGFGDFTGNKYPYGNGLRSTKAPRYIIEQMVDNTPGKETNRQIIYRITAMGFGPNEQTQVVLQTTFKKD